MAKVQDKLVDVKGLQAAFKIILDQLDNVFFDIRDKISQKLNSATNPSLADQVLTANGDGTWSWKNPQVTSATVEADVRRIVNEQLAKTKYTINDQGHLIIETPEA